MNNENLPVTTETVKVQLAVLPLPSTKVNVTSVLPTGKALPEKGLTFRRATDPEVSVAVASGKVTATDVVPSSTVWVMSAGQVTAGGVVSTR